MHRIIIGDPDNPLFDFDSDALLSINYLTNVAIVGDELAIDTFTAEVSATSTWDYLLSTTDYDGLETDDDYVLTLTYNNSDLRLIPYGTVLRYYHDGVLYGKFYVEKVTRTARAAYTIEAFTAVGLFDAQQHLGGLYTGETFEDVVDEIIDGVVPYSVEPDLATQQVYNWLPIATKRQNLHQLMFAMGATLTKDSNGDVVFSYLYDGGAVNVPDDRIYCEGAVDYTAPVSRVELAEHSWQYVGNEEIKTLFDNTDGSGVANQLFVAFSDAPINVSTLQTTGTLTIDDAGVNYAVVSGTGKLTGQPYTHTTHVVVAEVNDATEENVVVVDGATLVSVLNSQNVVDRLLAFYSSAKAITSSIVLADEHCGRQITFNDPFGEPTTAFIAAMSVNASVIDKAECTLIADYSPTGQGNNYHSAEVLSGTGSWTVPDDITEVKAVIIGGGQGGYCGHNGNDGAAGGVNSDGAGGDGGASGAGGSGGNVYSVTISVTGGQSISYTCGTGGAGGVATALDDEVAGTLGTDTTFGAYSSAAGAVPAGGYLNVFTGEIYAATGLADGIIGATGGGGTENGDDSANATGGAAGDSEDYQSNTCYGGGGGGAAYGGNGGDGANGWFEIGYNYITAHGGGGGTGGHPIARTKQSVYGCGGNGGHSGGGGGGGGAITRSYDVFSHGGAGGAGGLGGDGGEGGDGCVVIFY